MKTQTDQNITKKKRILVPLIIASITFSVALFLLILGLWVGFLYVKAKPKRELQTKLDLGEKYVNDMEYENAILTYKEAIEIDPKCVEAYLGIGNAYLKIADSLVENGFVEEAIDYLDEGIKELKTGYINTQSEEIADKINELEDSLKKLISAHEETEDLSDEVESGISGIEYLNTIKKYHDAIINHVEWDQWDHSLGDYYYFGYGETGYIIEDINGDEIPELMIGFSDSNDAEWEYEEGVLLALYTYKDGEVIKVLQSYERALYKYHEDGVFEYIWNGSSEDNGTEYYRFSDESGVKLYKIEESTNASLKIFQYEPFREFNDTEEENINSESDIVQTYTNNYLLEYENFIINEEYRDKLIYYSPELGDDLVLDFGNDMSISYRLYDMDHDGIKELIIGNGYDGRASRACYGFTYFNNKVYYIGVFPTDAFILEDDNTYVGVFGLFNDGGENWTYYEKRNQMIIPRYLCLRVIDTSNDYLYSSEYVIAEVGDGFQREEVEHIMDGLKFLDKDYSDIYSYDDIKKGKMTY